MTAKPWPTGAAFAGVAPRSYDQMAVDSVANWADLQAESLTLRLLWLTQDRLTISAMMGLATYSTDSMPRVVLDQGRYQLEDGHHRVVRAALRGATYLPVRIFRV